MQDSEARILTAIGELKTDIQNIKDDLDELKTFKDELQRTQQSFIDYKETRKDLPKQISDLKEKVTVCQTNCINESKVFEQVCKEVKFLMGWYKTGTGVVISVNVLVAVLVLVSKYIDISKLFS